MSICFPNRSGFVYPQHLNCLFLLFCCIGEEGCGSFVQQYCETSDWHPYTHCRIHLYSPTDPLYASERVSHLKGYRNIVSAKARCVWLFLKSYSQTIMKLFARRNFNTFLVKSCGSTCLVIFYITWYVFQQLPERRA